MLRQQDMLEILYQDGRAYRGQQTRWPRRASLKNGRQLPKPS